MSETKQPPLKRQKLSASNGKVVLLDIEGTTTPITFVHDVLFPYASTRVEDHLRATWNSEETQEDVKALLADMEKEKAEGQGLTLEKGDVRKLTMQTMESMLKYFGESDSMIESLPRFNRLARLMELAATALEKGDTKYQKVAKSDIRKRVVIKHVAAFVRKQIEENRKATALKQLQGHMWRTAYEQGTIKGAMYTDVEPCLESWTRRGYAVYIYSSGSVEAQKLIFGYSSAGDLKKYISGYFDTTTGPKMEAKSYELIAASIGVDPASVLFVTDRIEEADAASASGLEAVLSVRPGNKALPDKVAHPTIQSFVDLKL